MREKKRGEQRGGGAEEQREKGELIIFGYKALVNPTQNFTSPSYYLLLPLAFCLVDSAIQSQITKVLCAKADIEAVRLEKFDEIVHDLSVTSLTVAD